LCPHFAQPIDPLNRTITAIQTGAVNREVEITLAGNEKIVAVVTCSSTASPGLAAGPALTKAASVIAGVNA
jgi:molybdate transport system regulatory protein